MFAFSSVFEGLGGAVIEAMAMEVPVIAVGCPAVEEVLGGCGRLTPPGRTDTLAAALTETLSDRTALVVTARRGRQRFDSTFAIPTVAARMSAWYRRFIA